MILKIKMISILLILLVLRAQSQTFTEIQNTGISNLKKSNATWCDYDNDSDLDLLFTGTTNGQSSGAQTILYKNNGSGQFTAQQSTGFNAFYDAKSIWSDFNNDGFIDVLIIGKNTNDQPTTILYKNNAGSGFTAINTPIINIYDGDASFGDYNNDGLKDLIIAGNDGLGLYTKLYTNIGNNQFVEDNDFYLRGYYYPTVQWVDMNKDGFLDIVFFGGFMPNFGEIQVLENLKNGHFEKTMTTYGTIIRGSYCRMDIGDVDNDGDLDIIANASTSNINDANVYIFKNINSTFVLQQQTIPYFIRVGKGNVNFGDYDNDGDIDILISGNSDTLHHSIPYSGIYNNDGIGNFSFYHNSGIDSAIYKNSSWADFDNDGDLDVLLCDGGSLGTVKLFENNITTTNTTPSIPTNLNITKSNGNYILSWNRSTDLEDIDSLITYNLKIGTSANTENVSSSESNPNTGYRRVLKEGYQRDTFAIFKPFIQVGACENIFYSVQAIDRNNLSSGFSSAISDTNSLVILLSQDTLIKLGDSITISVQDNSCNTPTYQWTQSSSLIGSNTPNPTVFPKVSTKYYVTVTDGNMQKIDSVSVDVSFMIEDTIFDIEPVDYANCEWADLDNDGDLDIIEGGNSNNGLVLKVYQNINGSFTQVNIPNLTPLEKPVIRPTDFNHDGLIDLYIEGKPATAWWAVDVYINNGNFNFTKYDNLGLDLLYCTGTLNGDFNNDGKEDILVFSNLKTTLYSADSLMNYSEVVDTSYSLPHGHFISKRKDMNNDGFMDIVAAGSIDVGQPSSLRGLFLIENNKGQSFKTKYILPISFSFTSMATEDVDNDGNIDVIISGYYNNTQSIKVIKNNGNGNYTELSSIKVAYSGIIKTADYDNDGDIDFVLVGMYETHIYINDGQGNFVEDRGNRINGYKYGGASWGDYNMDRKLDLLVYGNEYNFGKSVRVYYNIGYTFNFPPFKPNGLVFDSTSALIRWAIPVDDHTSSNSLSYDIAIKTANTELYTHYPNSNLSTGYRKISTRGNIYSNTFYKPILPYDSSYYVKVQGIDQSFNGSQFSDSIEFIMPPISKLPPDTIIKCNTSMQLYVEIVNGDTAGITYNWSPANTLNINNISNPIASPLTNEWYKVQISSPNGHSYIDSILVEVGLRIYGDSVNIICGDTVQGQFSLNSNDTNIRYSWSPIIGISDSTILNPMFFSTSPQTYTLSATDSLCSTSKSINVNIDPIPPFVYFSASQTEFDTVPFIVEFTNWSSSESYLYDFDWNFGDGNILQDNNNIVNHTYNQSGVFSVNLTAINNITGCIDSLYGENYINCSVVGLNSPAKTIGHLTTYPNPNNGTFTLKLNVNSNSNYKVSLYNISGQEVFTKFLKGQELNKGMQIDANYLKAGLYIIYISSDKENYFNKIIVE